MSPESSPRILVVEDEAVVALSLQQQLRELGYSVAAIAATGEEALLRAEQLGPDLVLMDVRLKGPMDGVEAAGEVRRRFRIPVIYLTAYSNREIMERAKVTEPYGYILKPYEDRELHMVIEMALYKHRMERKLEERERWFAATLRSIGDAVVATDAQERVTFMNPVAEQLTGWAAEEARGRDLAEVFRIVNEATKAAESPVRKAIRERKSVPLENHTVLIARDQAERPIDDCAAPILGEDGRVVGGVLVFRDMTERRKSQEQFLQAQKMEAVGRLAGGVAHDFNNMMTVVTGFSQVLLGTLPPHHPSRPLAEEIKKAGERAAGLTAQLLTFSRRQMVQLKVIDLNALVGGLRKMLAPLIGEDVELVTRLAPDLVRIKADPVQVEQVLLNLAVNARDAMPQGGTLTIETSNVCFDRRAEQALPEVRPGPYALLRVCDTGTGMDRQTLARIFEPFFTTKEVGKGTGLGLATVHGIVKQSEGHIQVESEVGRGTTFRVYFPALEGAGELLPAGEGPAEMPGGRETVLLVEDEEGVRGLERHVLHQLGYNVLTAADGAKALEVARLHPGRIDLLVTDVVMPLMNGRELAEALLPACPRLKVLYLSGHTEDAVLRHGVREEESAFLHKPFTLAALSQKVRKVLDSPKPG
jgi:PAS domain S-box-containing protein